VERILGGRSKKYVVAFPSKELKNMHIQVSFSLAHILWQALENATKCLFVVTMLFLENLGRCSLNFGSGKVAGFRFKGEDTCHGVVAASSSN
jgi:hypothetical protein